MLVVKVSMAKTFTTKVPGIKKKKDPNYINEEGGDSSG